MRARRDRDHVRGFHARLERCPVSGRVPDDSVADVSRFGERLHLEQQFERYANAAKIAASTRKRWSLARRTLKAQCGQDDLARLTSDDVAAWISHLRGTGRSDRTIRDVHLVDLKALLGWLVGERKLVSNVTAGFPRQVDQASLFYEFSLERRVPAGHLLRSIDRFVDLSDLRRELAPFYSTTGRPSINPELLLRLYPARLAADAGYGSAGMLGWLVYDHGIEPHVSVFDRSARRDGTFQRDAFTYDHQGDVYFCPAGKMLTTNGTLVNDGPR